MKLNKATKETIILGLVSEATKKSAPSMIKAAKALDKLWRALMTKHAQLAMPEVPPARWPELIQSGMLTRVASYTVKVKTLKVVNDKEVTSTGTIEDQLQHPGAYSEDRAKSKEKADKVLGKMMSNGWEQFDKIVNCASKSYYVVATWRNDYYDIPGLNTLSYIKQDDLDSEVPADPSVNYSREAWPLYVQSIGLASKFLQTLKQGIDYYDQLQVIFTSINTDTALLDLFPEAAKYLPQQIPKTTKGVAPLDLIANARKMLVDGIPN